MLFPAATETEHPCEASTLTFRVSLSKPKLKCLRHWSTRARHQTLNDCEGLTMRCLSLAVPKAWANLIVASPTHLSECS